MSTQPEVGVDPHRDLVNFLHEQDELGAQQGVRSDALHVDSVTRQMVDRINPVKGPGGLVFEPCVMTRKENIFIDAGARIDAFTKLEGGKHLHIANEVHIASFCHLNIGGGETILCKGSSMGSGAKTISGGNQPDSQTCSAHAPKERQVLGTGSVILNVDSCLYAGAIVYAKPGTVVMIGQGARVGALSLVLESVPAGELWAGVPAKFIRKVAVGE